MSKDCSKCGEPIEESREGQRYCKICHNNHAKETRKRYNELNEEQKLKANCRSYLNTYLRRGKIIKQPCQVCECLKVEAHHNDYNKPLEVIWLCRVHHMEVHEG